MGYEGPYLQQPHRKRPRWIPIARSQWRDQTELQYRLLERQHGRAIRLRVPWAIRRRRGYLGRNAYTGRYHFHDLAGQELEQRQYPRLVQCRSRPAIWQRKRFGKLSADRPGTSDLHQFRSVVGGLGFP